MFFLSARGPILMRQTFPIQKLDPDLANPHQRSDKQNTAYCTNASFHFNNLLIQ